MAGPPDHNDCSDGSASSVHPGICCCAVYLFNILKPLLRVAGINIATLAILLLIVDVLASISIKRDSFRAISPVYHHGFVPSGLYKEEWVPGTLIEERLNPYGMRSNSSEHDTSPVSLNQYKTVLIGDSFAEGVGVPKSQIIPSLLPPLYGPVANLGVRSHSPTLSLFRLLHYRDRGLNPKYIIHLIDSSDIQDEYHYSEVEGFFSCSFSFICPTIQALTERYFGRLYSTQILLRGIWWLNSKRYGNPDPFSVWGGRNAYYRSRDPYLPSKAPYFEKGLGLMLASIAQIRQVYPHAKYIPVVYPPYSIVVRRQSANPYFGLVLTSVQNLFKSDPGVTVCSPSEPLLLSGDSLYIRGDSHWNAKGHKLLAKYISDNCIGR